MSRIGTIREAVEKSGGTVRRHYANGSGSFGGFSNSGENAGKVLYKVDTLGIFDFTNVIAELEVARFDIESAYVCTKGYLKVVFRHTA